MHHRVGTAMIGAVGLSVLGSPAFAQTGRKIDFTRDVVPIFQNRCTICHGVQPQGGLRLDTHSNLMRGGAGGPVIVPRDPNRSKLIGMVEGRIQPRMPKGGQPLSQIEIATLRAWVQQGSDLGTPDAGGGPVPGVPGANTARGPEGAEPTQPLKLIEPKDGATVKEQVKILIPRNAIPADGFVSIYIDKKFRVALAPQSDEDLEAQKLPADAPIKYLWDTKAPVSEDTNLAGAERFAKDGPHTIEIIAHRQDGGEVERTAVQVNLRNVMTVPQGKPVQLSYGGRVGQSYYLQHHIDLEATAAAGGFKGVVQGQTVGGGTEKYTHEETGKYLISLEDITPATGMGFWRERRESPMTVIVNSLKNVIQQDASSRYYGMDRFGRAFPSKAMEREKREAVINPIDLPGRPMRIGESFPTTLRLNLGAYIPATVTIPNLQATIEGMEWQSGEPCAKISLKYLTGNGTIDINSLQMQGAKLDIQQGVSTIWFSQTTKRVVRATHDVTGTLTVDTSAMQNGGMGGLGGELGPGMGGPAAPGGFGAPFGGGSPYGGAGIPGGSDAPGAAGPGMGGGPYGGGGSPYGGGAYGGSGGMAGSAGAFGGGTGVAAPRKFGVKLKVNTGLTTPPVDKKNFARQ